jgi:tetratricopeptide (TPR) repeat protein
MRYFLYILIIVLTFAYISICACPAIADWFFRQSLVFSQQSSEDNLQKEVRLLYRAISLDPMNAAYYYQLGKTYSKMKAENYKLQAVQEYQRAVVLNPTNSKYHGSLAWAYGRLADKEKLNMARKEFELAIQLEPNNSYRHRAYAIYCFNQARLIDSNANIATNSISPKEPLLNTAIFEYRQAVNIDSSFAEEAIRELFFFTKDYNKLKQILPNLAEFHLTLASFLQDKDAWIENETKFKDEMNNATDKALYYIAISRWHYRCKDYNKAFSILYDCLTVYPDNAEIHFTIADFAIYGISNYELAFKEVKNALELEPKNIHYRYWYAKWLFYRRNYREAEAECKKILSLNPDRKDARDLLDECKNIGN